MMKPLPIRLTLFILFLIIESSVLANTSSTKNNTEDTVAANKSDNSKSQESNTTDTSVATNKSDNSRSQESNTTDTSVATNESEHTTPRCRGVRCKKFCYFGWKTDANGCEICSCREREAGDLEGACSQPKKHGSCNAWVFRYYYNQEYRQCQTLDYSGCDGNKNNFPSLESCKTICEKKSVGMNNQWNNSVVAYSSVGYDRVTTPKDSCQQPKETGWCKAIMRRYYYNQKRKECETFIYGGCGGNDNNWPDLKTCYLACIDAKMDLQCDRKYTSKSTEIFWPSIVDVPFLDCTYVIYQPKGVTINLTLSSLDHHPNKDLFWCTGSIEIHTGTGREEEKFLKSLCLPTTSDEKTMSITSTEGITLRFKSDTDTKFPKFLASYTSTPGGCGYTFTSKDNFVATSPGYPEMYPDALDCENWIKAPSYKVIKLTIKYDIESSFTDACDYDKLVIYDGDNRHAPQLAKLCGEKTVELVSKGQDVYFHFTTDYVVGKKGFQATYEFLPAPCRDPGYHRIGQSCYRVYKAQKTKDAVKTCRQDGANLVSFETERELTAVGDYLEKTKETSRLRIAAKRTLDRTWIWEYNQCWQPVPSFILERLKGDGTHISVRRIYGQWQIHTTWWGNPLRFMCEERKPCHRANSSVPMKTLCDNCCMYDGQQYYEGYFVLDNPEKYGAPMLCTCKKGDANCEPSFGRSDATTAWLRTDYLFHQSLLLFCLIVKNY